MKYLRLVDHLGNEVLKLEVFVEGQDLEWRSAYPQAFWLGKIELLDKIPEPELEPGPELMPEPEIEETFEYQAKDEFQPEPAEPELEPTLEPELVIVCKGGCGRTTEGMTMETKVGKFEQVDESGVPDWTCPDCLEKEVISEPETVGDKGDGDEGPGASEQPESVEVSSEGNKPREPAKRGKRPRKRKAD